MLDKIKYYFHVATDKYFLEVAYVEAKPGQIPELVDRQYIIYNDKDGSMDYTKDYTKATCFGIILGGLVVKKLRKECVDLPNLQFSLISCNDAAFIDTVSGGSAVAFQSDKNKKPIDFAADELFKKYDGKKNVSVAAVHEINTEKKTHNAWIEIKAYDPKTEQEMKKEFADNVYKKFPVKIKIAERPKVNIP